MIVLNRLIAWYGKRAVYGALAAIFLLVIIGGSFAIFGGGEATPDEASSGKRIVLKEAGMLETEGAGLRTVGTVRAISEARLETEAGGRVTSVTVALGDRVSAGQVLASIENSRERAALLQAEGAYESALILNNQDSNNLEESEFVAENTFRTSLTVADNAIRNLADELFTNPDSPNPGLRIDGQGQATRLGSERRALEDVLDTWTSKVQDGVRGDKLALLHDAERDLIRINSFITDLGILVAEEDANAEYTAEVLSTYKTRFLSARSSLDSTLGSVSSARTALENALQSASDTTATTESDARLKQALGSLRAAQASYEKTLVRSPIAGVVNAMYLRANEYVSQGIPAAIVANNSALEITTSVNEEERALVSVGQKVMINGDHSGVVTRIAPAVDPATGKIEVKISVDADTDGALENGTTVSLVLEGTPVETNRPLRIPLKSIKITPQGPMVFIINDAGELAMQSVTLGTIVGNSAEIKAGLERTTKIVTDARGLKEGEQFEVVTE